MQARFACGLTANGSDIILMRDDKVALFFLRLGTGLLANPSHSWNLNVVWR